MPWPSWRAAAPVVAVLLVAAFLRLNSIGYAEFKADEAELSYMALQAWGGVVPLAGLHSSLGVKMPPLSVYLLMLPFGISPHPAVASAFVGLVNVAAVFLTWVFVRRWFGPRPAILSALFFAVNPWAVLFSRKIWSQDFLPFFTLLFFISLLEWVRGSRWFFAGALASLSCMVQLHLTAAYLALLVPILWLSYRPPVGLREAAAGAALASLLLLPYMVFEAGGGFGDAVALASYFARPDGFQPQSLVFPLWLASCHGFEYSLGDDFTAFAADYPGFAQQRFPLSPLDVVLMLLLIVGGIYLFFRRREPQSAALILWLLVPSAALVFAKAVIYVHYYVVLIPAPYIILGVLLDRALSSSSRRGRMAQTLVWAVVAVLACHQALFTLVFQDYVAHAGSIRGDYGTPLQQKITYLQVLSLQGRTADLGILGKNVDYKYLMEHVLPGG